MQFKMPFYNILNMLLAGVVFSCGLLLLFPGYMLEVLDSELLINKSTATEAIFIFCFFSLAYEIGLIINRIGSVLIGALCKYLKWIDFDDDYAKFNKKKKEFPILETLSREYALSRTMMTVFLILALVAFCICSNLFGSIFIGIAIIYFLSYKKYAIKITILMNSFIGGSELSCGD